MYGDSVAPVSKTIDYQCAHCETVVSTVPAVSAPAGTTFLVCPKCKKGTVKIANKLHPSPAAGRLVEYLPPSVDGAWREARLAYSAGAYTASTLMCRKLLMHMAVNECGADAGDTFKNYITKLTESGELPNSFKPALDAIRDQGNAATHELAVQTEAQALRTLALTEACLNVLYEVPGKLK